MEQEKLIELIRKGQAGEAWAVEELLRTAHTSVSYQCRKMLRTPQDAEDVTQEILLTLYTKLDTLKEPAAFWGWLNRITATRCMNALSRTHIDLQITEDEDGHSMLDDIENTDRQMAPEEAFDNAETARMIEEIVDGLPEMQRMCVLLYYYDELSVKEISETLGSSENTVKSRLNYARKAIKERVLDYEKQGIRLRGFTPFPFLLYFLRKSAESSADAVSAQRMAAKAMADGAAAAGIAAGGSTGAAAGASTVSASSTAAGVAQGMSMKAIAGIIAGLLVVSGAASVITMAVNKDKLEQIESRLSEEYDEDSDDSSEEPIEEPEEDSDTSGEDEVSDESEDDSLLGKEYLSRLPYTGDRDECMLDMAQAAAFAEILDECIIESQNLEMPFDNMQSFCRAALFDAGGGIPALWVSEGYETMPRGDLASFCYYSLFKIYCWDGLNAVLSIDSRVAGDNISIYNCNLTDEGLFLNYGGLGTSGLFFYDVSELYTLSDGMVSEAPLHVLECFTLDPLNAPDYAESVKGHTAERGYAGMTYDFDTLTPDKWIKDKDELSPMVYTVAVDGNFVNADTVFGKDRYQIFWEEPDKDCKLGHGEQNYTAEGRYYWMGEWGDAAELANLLRNGGAPQYTEV